jgi:hypothetical protein
VVDFTDAPMPGVTITIASPAMQGIKVLASDQDGDFFVTALPVGKYELRAELEGFKSILRKNLVVRLGGTVTLRLVMKLPELGEEIDVVDSAPAIDTEKLTIGDNLSHDFISNLPVLGGSFQSVVAFMPGVVDNGTGNPNVMGQGARSNQYFVDGVNTTDPVTNTFSANLNFDAIEEIEVISAGYDVRYGSATGAIINVVTKSGGNTFEGDFSAYFRTSDLVAGETLAEDSPTNNRRWEARGSVGGPILKDRLWFFGSYQYINSKTQLAPTLNFDRDYSRFPLVPEVWGSHYLHGKLTWQANDSHKVQITAESDPTSITNFDTNFATLPEALGWWRQGGWFGATRWDWTINPRMHLRTDVSYLNSYIKIAPMRWKDCDEHDSIGRCVDEDKNQPAHTTIGGLNYGNAVRYDFDRRNQAAVGSNLTASVDNVLGDHTFDIGVGYTWTGTKRDFGYLGNAWFIDVVGPDGDINAINDYRPSARYVIINNLNPYMTGNEVAGYIGDRWRPWDNLSVNAGARVDYSKLNSDFRSGVINWAGVSGGVGLGWDPGRDGRTQLSASYARVVEGSFLEQTSAENRSGLGWEYYTYDNDEQRYNLQASTVGRPDSGITHTSIVPPRMDQVTAGVRRELQRDLAGSLMLIWSSTRHHFEDDEVNLIWNGDGTDVVGNRNGVNTSVYRARTARDAFRRYLALQVEVRKNLSDNFELRGSYQFADTWTNLTTGYVGQVFSSYFDNPQQRWYETGRPSTIDRPHVAKVIGTYDNPSRFKFNESVAMGFRLGWVFEFTAGSPYNRFVYNQWDNSNSNLIYQRGTRFRLPATSKLDLRGVVALTVKGVAIDVIVEVFNVFNSRQITNVYQAIDDADGEPRVDSEGYIRFALPSARQGTRRLNLGARVQF